LRRERLRMLEIGIPVGCCNQRLAGALGEDAHRDASLLREDWTSVG
jgi:hypothetical protein